MLSSLGYDREANDAYYEPMWCDERLFEFLSLPHGTKVWDCACGTGTIVEAAKHAGLRAIGTDIVQRWHDGTKGYGRLDFLEHPGLTGVEAIVSNPPYKHAQAFAAKALTLAPVVAMLLPTIWVQGKARSQWLQETPLKWMLPLVPRPSMPPIGSDVPPGGGKVDYSWFVWEQGYVWSPIVEWLRK